MLNQAVPVGRQVQHDDYTLFLKYPEAYLEDTLFSPSLSVTLNLPARHIGRDSGAFVKIFS